MTFLDLANHVCSKLPEDWQIAISMTQGSGDVELYDPYGEKCRNAYCCDSTLEEQVLECVAYAISQAAGYERI